MAPEAPAVVKIPTRSPQRAHGKAGRATGRAKAGRPATGRVLANGTGRAATRGGGEVIELEYGIIVCPARDEHGRWRAVWHEDGQRQQCEAATEQKLAARLGKVTERLQAGAPDMKRKHAHTQRRLCERFAIPVIGSVICQDITAGHMRQIVNAAPTPGEGNRVQG